MYIIQYMYIGGEGEPLLYYNYYDDTGINRSLEESDC